MTKHRHPAAPEGKPPSLGIHVIVPGSPTWQRLDSARERLLADDRRSERRRAIPKPPVSTKEKRERTRADFAHFLDVSVRRRLQATKFIPAYSDRWQALVRAVGDSQVVIDALGSLRLGKSSRRVELDAALLTLAGFPSLGLLGPVDPENLDDFPPGLSVGRLSPWSDDPPIAWLAQYLGIDTRRGVEGAIDSRTGDERHFDAASVPCRVDLHATNTELLAAVDMIRREVSASPTRRRARERGWWGRRGLNAAFRLLRMRDRRKRSWSDEAWRGSAYLSILRDEVQGIERERGRAATAGLDIGKGIRPRGRRAERPPSLTIAAREAARLASIARREAGTLAASLWLDPEWEREWAKVLARVRR